MGIPHTNLFTELDHRLSVIKRYSILHTLQTQSVAEHIFNVERIAVRLLKWLDVDDLQVKWDVMKWAHHHEDFEALHGDLPSMTKPYFDNVAFETEHSDILDQRHPATDFVKHLVKLADLMEMYRFLVMETSLGNNYVINHVTDEAKRIAEFLVLHKDIFPARFSNGVLDWIDFGQPTKSIRHSRRGK